MIRRLTTAIARALGFDNAVQVTPEVGLMPDILVAADGYEGYRLLRQVRRHLHIDVYWPGRGETYLAGRPVGRVTLLSDAGLRISSDERQMLRDRMATFGPRALWVEL